MVFAGGIEGAGVVTGLVEAGGEVGVLGAALTPAREQLLQSAFRLESALEGAPMVGLVEDQPQFEAGSGEREPEAGPLPPDNEPLSQAGVEFGVQDAPDFGVLIALAVLGLDEEGLMVAAGDVRVDRRTAAPSHSREVALFGDALADDWVRAALKTSSVMTGTAP